MGTSGTAFFFTTASLSIYRGGGKRDRTADLRNAIATLSQLSYTPTKGSDYIDPAFFFKCFRQLIADTPSLGLLDGEAD